MCFSPLLSQTAQLKMRNMGKKCTKLRVKIVHPGVRNALSEALGQYVRVNMLCYSIVYKFASVIERNAVTKPIFAWD